MISYFDVFTTNRLEGINKELGELNSSTLKVINFETYENYTRVWYSREEIISEEKKEKLAKKLAIEQGDKLKEAYIKIRDE